MASIERIRLERTRREVGIYVEGVAVYDDGTEEVLDSTVVRSPRDYKGMLALKRDCQRQAGI